MMNTATLPVIDAARPLLVRVLSACLLLAAVLPLSGCQTVRELASLREVNFDIERVAQAELAGVNLERVRAYEDLSATDALRLTRAASSGELPLSFTLHINGTNPQENDVQARLTKMDWTLLLEDKETVSGVFDQNIALPPGEPIDIPIDIRLDLVEFFGDNVRDLVNLALNIAGERSEPTNIKLRARPTVNTAIGPIRYPGTITIVNRDVGS